MTNYKYGALTSLNSFKFYFASSVRGDYIIKCYDVDLLYNEMKDFIFKADNKIMSEGIPEEKESIKRFF